MDGFESRSRSNSPASDDESDSEMRDYAAILQSLINSGQLHIMASELTENYAAQDIPKIKYLPNTDVLDKSEFTITTKQAAGLGELKRKMMKSNNLTKILINRELGANSPYKNFTYSRKCSLGNRFLPNVGKEIDCYSGKAFCGIYSKDGNRFITASQDRHIRIYNSEDSSYKVMKTIRAKDVGWSIIDVAFSPDQKGFVYSTWSSALHLCSVDGDSENQEPLRLVNTGRRFCVFSVVFSSDGKELLGGANDGCLYLCDRQTHKRTSKISAHDYDVNSVAFADESSNIIYSGGDDGLVKVWDRRTLKESYPKAVGILAGHMDGVTFVDSRNDGRHLISNSKDQSIKLWDIRVFSGPRAAQKSLKAVLDQSWDYRWQEVPKKLYSSKSKIDGDTSIMTYRGHVVVKTLVRCRFSPLETTGQRYIYTGCGLGQVVVYDSLTGKIVERYRGHHACVRDVSWHPYRTEMMSTSWDGLIKRWTYFPCDYDSDYIERKDLGLFKVNKNGTVQKIRRSFRIAMKNKNQSDNP